MRNKIIYDCFVGPPVFGVITAEDTLKRRSVFVEQLKNLVGFRTYYPQVAHQGFKFYEVGYFMELLYNGSPEAFIMLNMSDDHVEQSSHEIRSIKDKSKELLSYNVPQMLLDYCMKNEESLFSGESYAHSYTEDKKTVTKLGYDKEIAYICSLYLRLAKDVLLNEEFIVDRKDTQVLEAIKEGKFSVETIKKEYDEQKDEVVELLSKTKLPKHPSKDLLNELLFDIRGIKQIEETTERIW